MSNKHYLEYDPVSGNITDDNGSLIASHPAFIPVKVETGSDGTENIIKLKDAGFTAEEIILLKKAGL